MEKCLHGKKTLDYAVNSGFANLKYTNQKKRLSLAKSTYSRDERFFDMKKS